MTQETFEQEFQVSSPASLVVKNIRGMVSIQPGEAGHIQVTATKHVDSGDAKRTEIELAQDEDGSVKAIARFPEGSIDWVFGSKPCRVDFVIHTPRQCKVTVSGVSNDASITGLEGEISVNTVSGDLSLRDLHGDLHLHTVSGDVKLDSVEGRMSLHTVSGTIEGLNASGQAHLDTVSGDIRLERSNLPVVEAGSVSGDFELDTPLGEGPYHFHSVSGDLRLRVPEGTACSAELHTLSGRISTSQQQTSSQHSHGRQVVEVHGGGVRVALNSVSGNLSLVNQP